ncbi:MAG: RDD family protein [Candidatus Eisenbacteria bacterium]|nr:RDD family protein [Candidatus Eisenbacteria bacterium]
MEETKNQEARPEPKPEGPAHRATAKADLGKRFVAILIDGILSGLIGLVPVIGGLIGAAYMLTRDGLNFDFMDKRSLGKKLMKLRPVRVDGGEVDVSVSVKRNFIFAIPLVLMIIPVLGWILAPILSLVVMILEVVLVLSDEEGRRWGDKFAGTKVIEVDE